MNYNTRKQIRLPNYDYSQNGAYFITICTENRENLFGEIVGAWITHSEPQTNPVGARIARPITVETNIIQLSDIGRIVDTTIQNIPKHYPMVKLDKYVIMPNHIHMILIISDDGRAMRAPTISTVINQMKGYATKQIGFSVWQKLFYDHIIRNEDEYLRIWKYIDENPMKWIEDELYLSE